MDLFNFDPNQFLSFLLTFFRISLLVFLLPFFGGETLPKTVKAALCLSMALGLWPALSFSGITYPASIWEMILMLLGELVLGLTLGLVVRFVFAAVQTAGQVIGFQMGFAMMNVVDPLTGVSEAITAHFLYMVSLLTFLSLNGHLYLLKGLSQSFELVPPGGLFLSEELANQIFSFSANMFILAVKIAAPVMAAVFLVDLALGLIARAAPQMNVLFIGFPLKIIVGFLFLGLLFTILSMHMEEFISKIEMTYYNLLQAAS